MHGHRTKILTSTVLAEIQKLFPTPVLVDQLPQAILDLQKALKRYGCQATCSRRRAVAETPAMQIHRFSYSEGTSDYALPPDYLNTTSVRWVLLLGRVRNPLHWTVLANEEDLRGLIQQNRELRHPFAADTDPETGVVGLTDLMTSTWHILHPDLLRALSRNAKWKEFITSAQGSQTLAALVGNGITPDP